MSESNPEVSDAARVAAKNTVGRYFCHDDRRVKEAALIIHFAIATATAENDAEIGELREKLQEHNSCVTAIEQILQQLQDAQVERDTLRQQLAMANDAADKGKAGRELGLAYEECQKENEELKRQLEEVNRFWDVTVNNLHESAVRVKDGLLSEWFKEAREENRKKGLGDYWSDDSMPGPDACPPFCPDRRRAREQDAIDLAREKGAY